MTKKEKLFYARYMKLSVEEGRAEAMAEGMAKGEARGEAKGTIRTLVNLFRKGLINESSAAETAGMTVEDFRKAEALYCI